MSEIPIACTLDDAELRERRAGLLAELGRAVVGRRELPAGYGFRFPSDSSTLRLLSDAIDAERQCCAFLTFRLTVEPNGGPLWLYVEGPPGAKRFVDNLLEPTRRE